MILVSACLAGLHCRYDGRCSPDRRVEVLVSAGEAIPVCPEQLGGCTTPRPPVEMTEGTAADVLDGKCSVTNKKGEDVTDQFVKGAYEVLKLAELTGVRRAVLKARSPSCGCGKVYDGTYSGKLTEGNGVTAELLLRSGIEVLTEEEL